MLVFSWPIENQVELDALEDLFKQKDLKPAAEAGVVDHLGAGAVRCIWYAKSALQNFTQFHYNTLTIERPRGRGEGGGGRGGERGEGGHQIDHARKCVQP